MGIFGNVYKLKDPYGNTIMVDTADPKVEPNFKLLGGGAKGGDIRKTRRSHKVIAQGNRARSSRQYKKSIRKYRKSARKPKKSARKSRKGRKVRKSARKPKKVARKSRKH